MAPKHVLPEGLKLHCDSCGIAVPIDAPEPEGADCEWVVRSKLTWFNPNTTVVCQFTMAAAAWHLIHDKAIKANQPECLEYLSEFKMFRGDHYANSATYKALTDEQVKNEITHVAHGRRDRWLYDSHPVGIELKQKETTEYVAEENVSVIDGN